jgi:hypothetical protein
MDRVSDSIKRLLKAVAHMLSAQHSADCGVAVSVTVMKRAQHDSFVDVGIRGNVTSRCGFPPYARAVINCLCRTGMTSEKKLEKVLDKRRIFM